MGFFHRLCVNVCSCDESNENAWRFMKKRERREKVWAGYVCVCACTERSWEWKNMHQKTRESVEMF